MMKTSRWIPLLMVGLCAVPAAAEKGAAVLVATSSSALVTGTVTLTDNKEGLAVKAELEGIPAGDHGFHIHEFGSCDMAGNAAGGHFNPQGAPHGHVLRGGPKKAHAGDMGNIGAGTNGKAVFEAVLPGVSLSAGKHNVAGRAIILHEKGDDFGQPAGNAGGRIACGVIVITGQ